MANTFFSFELLNVKFLFFVFQALEEQESGAAETQT